MIRAVIVADDELRQTAASWARAGLIGESLWVDAGQCTSEALATTDPSAVALPSEEASSLTAFLADRPEVDRVRVVWCRRAARGEDADIAVAAMASLEARLPGRILKRDLVDLIGPQASAPLDWPVSAVRWKTVVVGPNDSVLPGGISALHGDDPSLMLLHAACAIAGILGGLTDEEPPSWGAGGSLRTGAADVYSSVLLGGDVLARRAEEFVTERLPTASALDLRPTQHTAELGAQLVKDAVALLGSPSRHDPISYRVPAPRSFGAVEAVAAQEHLSRIAGFADFVFLKSKPIALGDWLKERVADLLGDEDLGYDLKSPERGTIDITDYFAQDRELVTQLTRFWVWHTIYAQGIRPSSRIWQDLALLAGGLIDGGELPDPIRRPERDERVVAVPVDAVMRTRCADPETGAQPEPPTLRETTADVPHAPCDETVAKDAAHWTAQHLRSLEAPLVGTHKRGSRVTDRLAERAATLSTEIAADQLSVIEQDAAEAPALPMLERLRSNVLADLVSSAKDAERLFRLSVGELNQITGLRAATFWFLVGGAVAISAGVLISFGVWQDQILMWLAMHGLNFSAEQVWAGLGAGSTVLIAGPIVSYYYAFQRYMERGRRQLEARRMLFEAATEAWREHLRLRHADRTLQRWVTILSGIYPCRSPKSDEPTTVEKPRLPRNLQTADPLYTTFQLERWLAEVAAPTGWRTAALVEVVLLHLRDRDDEVGTQDPLGQLATDPHGLLKTLAEAMPVVWGRWLKQHQSTVDAALKGRVGTECARVAPRLGEETPRDTFLSRVRDEKHVAAVVYERPPLGGPSTLVQVEIANPVLCTTGVVRGVSQLYVRDLEPDVVPEADEAPTPPLTGDPRA